MVMGNTDWPITSMDAACEITASGEYDTPIGQIKLAFQKLPAQESLDRSVSRVVCYLPLSKPQLSENAALLDTNMLALEHDNHLVLPGYNDIRFNHFATCSQPVREFIKNDDRKIIAVKFMLPKNILNNIDESPQQSLDQLGLRLGQISELPGMQQREGGRSLG